MKYIKLFEAKRAKKEPKKEPKHMYDCENCKFNWCCGFNCSCLLGGKLGLPEAPEDSLYNASKKYNL